MDYVPLASSHGRRTSVYDASPVRPGAEACRAVARARANKQVAGAVAKYNNRDQLA
jgi:hypothetical protein